MERGGSPYTSIKTFSPVNFSAMIPCEGDVQRATKYCISEIRRCAFVKMAEGVWKSRQNERQKGKSCSGRACVESATRSFCLVVVDADADVVVLVVLVVDMLEARSSSVTSTGYTLVDPPRYIRYTPGQPLAHSGFNWYQLRLNHVADTTTRHTSYALIRHSN